MEILPNDINVTIVSIIKSTFYCHFLPSPDNLRTARRMALDCGLQLWRLWSEISHQFLNRCLESIVLKSLINATRLEAVEELWSLIVGYERHIHLLVSSLCHILVSHWSHHLYMNYRRHQRDSLWQNVTWTILRKNVMTMVKDSDIARKKIWNTTKFLI